MTFTDEQLNAIRKTHDDMGPRKAYSEFFNVADEDRYKVPTEKVEDFIIEFYEAYNKRFGVRY